MLTLWNGFNRSLANDLRRMDRVATGLPNHPMLRHNAWPRVNVVETEEAYEIQADVPGMTAKDIDVTLHDGELRLEGKLATDGEEKNEDGDRKVLFSERRQLEFTRTFKLNVDVDAEAVTAAVKDGVLTVTLPKAEASKPRQIQVASQ